MIPSDINHLVWVTDPALDPDATRVAYAVSRVDGEANRYRSRIWVRRVEGGGNPAPVTSGEWDDRLPAWSPDGSLLAFVTNRRREHEGISSSLYVLHVSGPGEASLVADHPEAITDVCFSPDGRWLSYAVRVRSDHYDADEVARRPPRRITRPFYRLNGAGVVADRPRHLHVAAVDGSGTRRDLTPGDDDWATPRWLPDSSGLVASRAAQRPPWMGSDLAVVPLDGDVRTIAEGGSFRSPAPSPDGRRVAFLGVEDLETYPQNTHVGVVELDDTSPVRWISHALDRSWEAFPEARTPTWLDDATVAASVQDRGRVNLLALDVDGSNGPAPIVGGDRTVAMWDRRGETIVFTSTDGVTPAELHVLDGDGERRLTRITADLCARVSPRPMEHFTASSEGAEVDAWIVTPPDMDPDLTHPVLLNIHGGPFTQYGHTFFDEFQMQAAAGFVVVFANPRGSSGRDAAWGSAIRGRRHGQPGRGWGDVDYADIMAVMDTALERFPFIDPERCGVLGGSYGGYMTSWI
ncbi:MAG: prolyl oligopeptidase family serine peptidase, partial [Actinomycetota bacterium]